MKDTYELYILALVQVTFDMSHYRRDVRKQKL